MLRKKFAAGIVILSLTAALFTACNATDATTTAASSAAETTTAAETTAEETTTTAEETTAAEAALPTEDRAGNPVTIPAEVNKIVSLNPATTQTLIDLGAADKIIAIDEYSAVYKDQLSADVAVYSLATPDQEAIVASAPDVVFTSGMLRVGDANPYQAVTDAGICILDIPSSSSIAAIEDDIKFIGASIGASDKAETIVNDLETKLSEIKAVGEKIEDADKKSVLFLLSVPTDDAPTIYSIGKNTFLDEILSDIGAKNVTGDMDSWVSISEEDAVAKNPDVILHSVSYVPEPEKAIMERKGWENVKAVKDKAVYYIDENASNRPNAHVIDAVYQMAKKIYPEQFKDFTDPFEKAQ